MNANEGTVDHLHLAAVRLYNSVHQAVPNACFSPTVEAVVGRRVGAVALRHVAPRRAGAQHPKDAVEHTPVVLGFDASPFSRQQRLDYTPLEVGQVVAHDPSSDVSELESLFADLCHKKLST